MTNDSGIKFGGAKAWGLLITFIGLAIASYYVLTGSANARYERDVTRMVFNDNLGVLEEVRGKLGESSDSLERLSKTSTAVTPNQPYIVISIAENKLWYKKGDSLLFYAPVATGSGKTMVSSGGSNRWKFDTPRGRLVVQAKDLNPAWVPPDWHFLEQARKRGLGLIRMERGQKIDAGGGVVLTTSGADVVKKYPNGKVVSMGGGVEDREIVVGGNIVIPPYGTNARRFDRVLGTRRLNLGDGYGIHGTNNPSSIGHSVSHGCVRLRNEDIEKLYDMVAVGTPVYIY